MAKRPAAPTSLKASGKRLWKSILSDLAESWELDQRELVFLARAGRCADELAKLEKSIDRDGVTIEGSRGQVAINPCLSEARQLRLVQLRLLSAIEMTDPQSSKRSATPAQARGRKAAEVRWQLEEARNNG